MFLARDKLEKKKRNGVLKSETDNLFQNNRVNSWSLLFCHSSVYPSISIKLCYLIPFSKYQTLFLAALEVKTV